MKRLIIIIFLLLMFTPCYAETFKEYINSPMPEKTQTKSELRVEWREALGWDAFSFYISFKDVEKRLLEKTKIRVYRFNGKLSVEESEKQVLYVFKYVF